MPHAMRAHVHLKMHFRMPVLHSFTRAKTPNSSNAGLVIKLRNYTLHVNIDSSQKCNVSCERSRTLTIALWTVLFTELKKTLTKTKNKTKAKVFCGD